MMQTLSGKACRPGNPADAVWMRGPWGGTLCRWRIWRVRILVRYGHGDSPARPLSKKRLTGGAWLSMLNPVSTCGAARGVRPFSVARVARSIPCPAVS